MDMQSGRSNKFEELALTESDVIKQNQAVKYKESVKLDGISAFVIKTMRNSWPRY